MSSHGQKTLILHLSSPESLRVLATEGLPPKCVPDADLRVVYEWSLDQFYRSGMTKAPSVAALLGEFGDLLSDRDIDIEFEPEDSVEWVIDDLKGSYIWSVSADFNKRFTKELSDTVATERMDVVDRFASELVGLSFDLSNQETRVDLREGIDVRIREYEARSVDRSVVYGMRLGIDEIDLYTRGIHPGELAVLAGGPKQGKSWFLSLVALKEFQAGRAITFFTMENSVEVTLDRIACLAKSIDYRMWQHGTCTPEDEAKVREWCDEVKEASNPLYVIQPPPGQRGVEALVRQAQLLGTESLILDQLSYLEPRDERQPRHYQVREITHALRGMISSGRHRMPCLLAHQISREGVKLADKADHLEMYHLAEGSETERTADWVFGLYRSRADVGYSQARIQTLASRREENKHFRLTWNVGRGYVIFKETYEI